MTFLLCRWQMPFYSSACSTIWIFINFDGQLPKNYHQENEIFPDPKCLGCCHSLTRPTVPVTKAVDGRAASPSGLLPFGCRVAAQRLNLTTFLIVVKRPGDRPCPFSDCTDPLPSPLPRTWCLYPCQRTAALEGTCFFYGLNPSTCIDQPPTSHLSLLFLPLIPHCFLVWNNIACLLLLIPEDWTPVSAPLSLVLY